MPLEYNASLSAIPENACQSPTNEMVMRPIQKHAEESKHIIKNDNAISCKLGHVYGSNKRIDLVNECIC